MNDLSQSIRYKYGIYVTKYDANSEMLFDVMKDLTIDREDIFLMDKEGTFTDFYRTTDRNIFFSSVDTILEIYDSYSSRHITSRFLFECIYNDKQFYIVDVSDYNKDESPKLNTLVQFKSAKYSKINNLSSSRDGKFKVYSMELDKSLILTETYRNYISKIFDISIPMEGYSQFKYCEDYL
jgi:hypothetical protein